MIDDYELGKEIAKLTSNLKGVLTDELWDGFFYQSGKQLFDSGGSLTDLHDGSSPIPPAYKKGFTDAYHANYALNCRGYEE
jgi:hypothetical protein